MGRKACAHEDIVYGLFSEHLPFRPEPQGQSGLYVSQSHADSEGRCWPGIRTIAAELGLSRSTVKRALDDLYGAGLLTREPRWRENGSHSSNLYRLV